MPTYDYECDACHHEFEIFQNMSDDPLTKCPKCKGPIEQLISAPAVQFKGSGWYVTDYAKGGSQPGSATGEAGSKDGKAKTEKASDDKSDSKKAGKAEPAKAESSKSETSSKKKTEKK